MENTETQAIETRNVELTVEQLVSLHIAATVALPSYHAAGSDVEVLQDAMEVLTRALAGNAVK